jgi:uncharacterized short protein YbdD (DUF466 family)
MANAIETPGGPVSCRRPSASFTITIWLLRRDSRSDSIGTRNCLHRPLRQAQHLAASTMIASIRRFWRALRTVTGDDAYERYLSHWLACHAHEGGEPLSRKAFYEAEVRRRWSGVKRCC